MEETPVREGGGNIKGDIPETRERDYGKSRKKTPKNVVFSVIDSLRK
jgi:hypothetical protein